MHISSNQSASAQSANKSAQVLLFRPEVLEARSSQWMGAIRLAQPTSSWLIAGLAIFIACCLITFIIIGSISKKARVTGITTPANGSLTIMATNAGTLVHQFVAEGQEVKFGQALFELSTERHGSKGEITALLAQQLIIRLQALEAERRTRIAQDSGKKRAIDAHLLNIVGEEVQLNEEIALARRRQELSQQSLKKFETLQGNGFVSATQTQQKQEDLIDISARLSALGRTKTQLLASRLGLNAEREALANEFAVEISQLDRAKASLKQEIVENQNKKTTLIKATHAGTLTTITNQPGQTVTAGQVLATIIPGSTNTLTESSNLEVHLYAPSRTVGFVAVGQNVLIRYQSYPYQKFGLYEGRVIDVSKTPFAPNELPSNVATTILSNAQQNIVGFNSNEALYRIKVRPTLQSINVYGTILELKPGMTLEADILQDRRRIWEWILEPVLAVAHK